MAITHVPGAAARAGVQSAYLAAAGFNCGDIAIDGRNGLLQVLTGGNGSPVLFDELGVHFEFLNNTYKPYPCGIVIHPMIDACLTISAEEGFDSTDIEHVDMLVHPDALHLTWRKLPTTELDAQVSLYHWAAAALVQRSAGIKQGELDCIMDPEVRQLQDKMHVEPDAALANNQARLSIHMKSGKVHSRFTDNAIGSVTNPMTDAQLVQKFFGLVVPVLGEAQAQTLLKSCQALALADDVTQHLSAAH
ncbi:hypothetical protein SDC9_119674 [bioreactor metagenome]|uniref:MmgE/PrpD C-terminal domain-containing protein n=1 Tax=bioreactor metagenome TaxID=1076179 RepID=A0A645C5R3_9ZZZZ